MNQNIDVSTLDSKLFKALQRQFAEEMKNRGPSGEKKFSTDTPGLQAIIDSIEALAQEKQSNMVEVMDAILREKEATYYIASSERKKSVSGKAQEASVAV